MPIHYHHYLIIVTLLTGLFYLRKNPGNRVLLLLCTLLFLNLCCELTANLKWYVFKSSNLIVYNIAIAINYGLWLWIVRTVSGAQLQKWVTLSVVLFFIFYFVNIMFIQGTGRLNTYSFLLGDIMVTFFSLKLFYNNIIHPEKYEPGEFNTSVLIAGLCYFTGFSVVFFTNEWSTTKLEIFTDLTAHQLIAYFINTIFYGLLFFAFIRKKVRT
jgi:hypothetical protein